MDTPLRGQRGRRFHVSASSRTSKANPRASTGGVFSVFVHSPVVEDVGGVPDLPGWHSFPKVLLAVQNAISTDQQGRLARAAGIRYSSLAYLQPAGGSNISDGEHQPRQWWSICCLYERILASKRRKVARDGPDRNVLPTICSLATLCTMTSQLNEDVRVCARLFEGLKRASISSTRVDGVDEVWWFASEPNRGTL